MITKVEFRVIDTEVKKCIVDTLDNIKRNTPDNYVLFLADAEYKPQYQAEKFSPYVIDNRIDYYKDENRLQFLSSFLNTHYRFVAPQESVDNNEIRLHTELMVYSHIWESKPFLKKLYRLAHLDNGEQYPWNVSIPDMSKHKFIREDIRLILEHNKNPLFEVIKKGFHTSLRNAFAHSEYSFDTMNGRQHIWLDNYKGEGWELQEISFDDWSKRFVYSALLSYHLFTLTHKKRVALVNDLGSDTFTIQHPLKDGTLKAVDIVYIPEHNSFNFKR